MGFNVMVIAYVVLLKIVKPSNDILSNPFQDAMEDIKLFERNKIPDIPHTPTMIHPKRQQSYII